MDQQFRRTKETKRDKADHKAERERKQRHIMRDKATYYVAKVLNMDLGSTRERRRGKKLD